MGFVGVGTGLAILDKMILCIIVSNVAKLRSHRKCKKIHIGVNVIVLIIPIIRKIITIIQINK